MPSTLHGMPRRKPGWAVSIAKGPLTRPRVDMQTLGQPPDGMVGDDGSPVSKSQPANDS
jgi:hypothetical protein